MNTKLKTAIVIGDVMLDRRIDGTVTKLSPESPIPIHDQATFIDAPGGAANVAVNLAAMGIRTQLVGAVGSDAAAGQLYGILQQYPGIASWLVSCPGTTTVKTRYTCGGQPLFRSDHNGHRDGSPSMVWPAFCSALQRDDVGVVVISDYTKGALTGLGPAIIGKCRELSIPVFVDGKPTTYDDYTGAHTIKPNLVEAMSYCETVVHPGLWVDQTNAALTAAQAMRSRLCAQLVIVTAGRLGAAYSTLYETSPQFVPAKSLEVCDPVGAGDTCLAAYTAAYLEGFSVSAAVQRAVVAGSLAVSRYGTTIITGDELDEAVFTGGGTAAKHMRFTDVKRYADRHRRAGKRIGFVNGCFDVLHPGHVALLQFAKQRCDVLVVAYDSDESVRLLKGDQRPIMPEAARAAGLEPYADAIVRFHTSELPTLLRYVHPDVLVKGAEYVEQTVVGADYVADYGGLVEFAPMVPGFSTTQILEKLRGASVV